MRNKDISEASRKMVDELLERVESMDSKEYKKILDNMAKFHHYSYVNQFILHCADASQVAGYKAWTKDHNRTVNKGAKAIWILAPNPVLIPVEKYKGSLARVEIVEKNGKKFVKHMTYRSVPVFDIADTDGEAIEKNMTTKADIQMSTLEKVALSLGYNVESEPQEVAIGGYISKKRIVLNSNLVEAENVGTLIHELAHGELGHQDDKDETKRSLKEQQAETVTYILCNMYGVNRNSEFYLKGWRLDKNINQSFSRINEAVKSISKEIEKILK